MLRSRITWLAAALVAGVVVSFVIPLCLLVRTMAEERAVSATNSDAQSVAMIVAGVDDPASLPAVLAPTLDAQQHGDDDRRSPLRSTYWRPDNHRPCHHRSALVRPGAVPGGCPPSRRGPGRQPVDGDDRR